MFVIGPASNHPGSKPLMLKCPKCRANGVFTPIHTNAHNALWDRINQDVVCLDHMQCPNSSCLCIVHVCFIENGAILDVYPPILLDFNTSDLSPKIVSLFEEVIKCHSQSCWIAAAIMIRRTLEELCDEQNAEGGDLYKRLEDLGSKVALPEALTEAFTELRLLGNDAAHIELKDFDQIGKEEVEAAIDVTKEILKGVYQMESLVNRLKALKNDSTP